jgi:hypothetical protein
MHGSDKLACDICSPQMDNFAFHRSGMNSLYTHSWPAASPRIHPGTGKCFFRGTPVTKH